MNGIILAAGVGSRLGRPLPKCLATLPSGETILDRQIRLFRQCGVERIFVVAGFKKNLIMEHRPDVCYVYNPTFYITNTSKSLLHGLKQMDSDVIWVNGDVVFDEEIMCRIVEMEGNVAVVNRARCGVEEVKYDLDPEGMINAISKEITPGLGEALGINRIGHTDLAPFMAALEACDDNDYFEKAMEMVLDNGVRFAPFDVSDYRCIEVDFKEDLQRALELFKH